MDIVLVPGLWLTGSSWDRVVPALRAAGHRTYPLTLPGIGADDVDPADVSLADHVAAVVQASDAGAGPVLLVGHSVGPGLARAAADAAPVAELARRAAVHWVDLDSGHWPQESCPARLAQAILDAAEHTHRR